MTPRIVPMAAPVATEEVAEEVASPVMIRRVESAGQENVPWFQLIELILCACVQRG